jgi:hypothetical protein
MKTDRWTNELGDVIMKPKHYTQGGIEPIDFITANKMDFCQGNVVKYVTRFKFKNGLEDLKKAEFYIKKLIEDYERINDKNNDIY